MLFFLGGEGRLVALERWKLFLKLITPPPPLPSIPRNQLDKRRAEKVSGPPAIALVFYNKLTWNDFAVCTKVNSYNL